MHQFRWSTNLQNYIVTIVDLFGGDCTLYIHIYIYICSFIYQYIYVFFFFLRIYKNTNICIYIFLSIHIMYLFKMCFSGYIVMLTYTYCIIIPILDVLYGVIGIGDDLGAVDFSICFRYVLASPMFHTCRRVLFSMLT